MTDSMTPGDQARVTVGVAVPPEEAFRVFTQEVDLWWRRGRRFRNARVSTPYRGLNKYAAKKMTPRTSTMAAPLGRFFTR